MTDDDFLEFEIRRKILNELQARGNREKLRQLLGNYQAIVVDEVGLIRWGLVMPDQ